MKLFLVILGLHLVVLASAAAKENPDGEKEQQVVPESGKAEERPKRANPSSQAKIARQSSLELPPEYINFLQQLSVTRDQGVSAQQQQQQPQQLVQQYVLPKDGLKQQQPPTRYVLSQDGRLIEEAVAYLGQQPQQQLSAAQQSQLAAAHQSHFAAAQQSQLAAAQQSQLAAAQQSQLAAAQQSQFAAAQQSQFRAYQQATPAPQLGRPVISPELAELSRQQQRLQQEYADAPLRAQIAGGTARARQRPVQQVPAGPNSPAPQVFLQSQQQQQPQPQTRADPRLKPQLQSENPNFVYSPVPVDAQTILQQQLAQLSVVGDADGRQIYAQTPRPVLPQQFIYQQPTQEVPQERLVYQQPQPQPQALSTRRPVPVTPTQQSPVLSQGLPQQYLIETTRPQQQQQQAQYVPQDVSPQQVQYVQQSQLAQQQQIARAQQQQQQQAQHPQHLSSTLLQPVPGRGIFDSVKPSRSSIYVSRSSSATPRPVALESVSEGQKVPVVRLPSPSEQRPLSRQEFEALVNAGYSVSPVHVPDPVAANYLKSKRQQPVLQEAKNHVIYENHQDGVQYHYSPGSSAPLKAKKSVTPKNADDDKTLVRAVADGNENGQLLAYLLALGNDRS